MATLNKMRNLAQDAAADPVFQEFVLGFSGWQDLLQWTRAHFIYRDETHEVVRDPRKTLEDMGSPDGSGRIMGLEGDCDDIATFLAACLKVLGYLTRFLAIRVNSDTTEFEHVVAQAWDEWFSAAVRSGEWITLDPTVQPGTVMQAQDELIENV